MSYNQTRTEQLQKAVLSVKNQTVAGAGNECNVNIGGKVAKTNDVTHVFIADISGLTGGVTTLNQGETRRKWGVNSFDGRKLNGRDFSIDAVAVRVDTKGIIGLADGSATYNDAPSGQVLNSLLILEQDGRVLFTLPVADLINLKESVSQDELFRPISNSPVILRDIDVDIKLRTAEGSTIPANTLFKIMLRGTEVK